MVVNTDMEKWKAAHPGKFASENEIFRNIRRGDRIFIGTACGEPQHLVNAMMRYVETHPKAFAEAEVFQIWSLGLAPYADERFTYNFRHNSFFVGESTRSAVNRGLADYTPIFLSKVPPLIESGRIPIDVALIQVSPPDRGGYCSLGISVDITKIAMDKATLVIAQVNPRMPRVHGDTFVHIDRIDYLIEHEEDLLEFAPVVPDEIAHEAGKYVARIVQDGDTIQVGYGSMPNAIMANIMDKNNLGVHSELLSDSMVELIRTGVIDNSRKSRDRGKTVASFCMGTKKTYDFIDDNPAIAFRTIDYTNHPRVISSIANLTSINAALQVDLTGQATAESIGDTFFSGIGGSADFMRSATFAPNGKTVLVLRSATKDEEISRIVPFLDAGVGVTLNRGDIQYVVTEYGIAYIHGKNIRERAMDLIAIAHPKFQPWLIEEAKKRRLIYKDQAFIPGKKGEYPEHIEAMRTTSRNVSILLRPVKISDEPLIKDFFYSLSDRSLYRRFMSMRMDIPHQLRQEFTVIDYTMEMMILACVGGAKQEKVVAVGQYIKEPASHAAEVAFAVRDDHQNSGIGTELLSFLTVLAKNDGLHGFTADVLVENRPMLRVFTKQFPNLQKTVEEGSYLLTMRFGETGDATDA